MVAITDLEFDAVKNDLDFFMIEHMADRHDAETLMMEVQYERTEWEDYYVR